MYATHSQGQCCDLDHSQLHPYFVDTTTFNTRANGHCCGIDGGLVWFYVNVSIIVVISLGLVWEIISMWVDKDLYFYQLLIYKPWNRI